MVTRYDLARLFKWFTETYHRVRTETDLTAESAYALIEHDKSTIEMLDHYYDALAQRCEQMEARVKWLCNTIIKAGEMHPADGNPVGVSLEDIDQAQEWLAAEPSKCSDPWCGEVYPPCKNNAEPQGRGEP